LGRSLIAPVLGEAGVILSGISIGERILIGGGLLILLFLIVRHRSLITHISLIETHDGETVLYRQSGFQHLLKLRPWGWAGPWGLNLAVSGKVSKKIFLSSSDFAPAQLRRLVRERIYKRESPQEHEACVQAPAQPRLWL
jgi:hypothetical protein